MLKILIVDDHALIRKGISAILRKHNSRWEIFEADNGIQAVLKAGEIRPDIILMDYMMPKLDGVNAAISIKKNMPDAKIILVSMDTSQDLIIRTIHAGVVGIVPKDSSEEELINAIEEVRDGKTHLNERVNEIAAKYLVRSEMTTKSSDRRNHIFTERETELLRLLIQGFTTFQMAEKMGISSRTAETHKSNIMKKCKLHSTASLIRFAIKNRIIDL